MFRKSIFVLSFIFLQIAILFPTTGIAVAETDVVQIEVFESDNCQHCQDEKAFLNKVLKERGDIKVNYYTLSNEEDYNLFTEITELEGISKATPITLIGEHLIQGFADEETTGQIILNAIEQTKEDKNYSFQEYLDTGGSKNVNSIDGATCEENSLECTVPEEPYFVKIPLIGAVDVKQYSLPTMSLILGFIDGFNPCAMWVLVTFLLILVQIGDFKKMLQIAGLFILAEAVMYYLILNVWLEVWNFVGLDNIITPIVGIVAIGGGLFFLWEWKKSDGTCKVVDAKKRAKTRSRIQELAAAPMTILTIAGVIGLALSVNIIEFACSIGIPQAFTKILDINSLSWIGKQFYMFLYIIMYMIDDVIVFGIALYSIEKIGITHKYSKLCNLIGGILMITLGLILIFKPELLVF